jgi:hypothetical protein
MSMFLENKVDFITGTVSADKAAGPQSCINRHIWQLY